MTHVPSPGPRTRRHLCGGCPHCGAPPPGPRPAHQPPTRPRLLGEWPCAHRRSFLCSPSPADTIFDALFPPFQFSLMFSLGSRAPSVNGAGAAPAVGPLRAETHARGSGCRRQQFPLPLSIHHREPLTAHPPRPAGPDVRRPRASTAPAPGLTSAGGAAGGGPGSSAAG